MKKTIVKSTFLLLTLMISCGGNKEEKTESSSDKIEVTKNSPTKTTDLFTDKSELQKAQKELQNLPEFKGKDVRVFQGFSVYADGRILIDMQNPDKPDNIDSYTYQNGKWSEPQPVQISGDGDMESNTFPLKDVEFETLAQVYKATEDKAAEIEGGKVNSVVYFDLQVHNQEKKWRTSIKGTREKWTGYFNPDGSLQKFEKN